MSFPRMTTRRWMIAVAIIATVIWFESSLFLWLSNQRSDTALLNPGVVLWVILHFLLALLLSFAIPLYYAIKWLLSPIDRRSQDEAGQSAAHRSDK